MGGVLTTLSAWVIGFVSFVARVRAEAEVPASPRLDFLLHRKYEAVNNGNTEKETGPASHRPRSARHVSNATNAYRSG